MLLMQSEREQPSLKVEGLGLHPAMTEYGRRYTNFLRNLETLVFRNAMPAGWSSWSYNKIVLLVLEAGDEKWSMTQTELASVLASCPRLQYLWLDNLEIRCSDEFMPPPVALNELRLLDVQAYDVKRMTESVLAILVPGPHPLRLNISIPWFPNSHIDTLAAVQLFVSQYNVTTLYIANYEDGPCFASQLGPFPRIKTLVLHVIHFSDTAWTEHQGSRATYASPDQASSVLWPDLRNLYLEECVLQKDHIRRLLSVHSVQALYMRKCYNGVAFREEFLMRSQDSEEFAQSLSDIVPKSVHFKEGWTQWPISSRFESW
ncbi:hypothetical protein FRC07_008423 [Ceratobasidium sp. 392]|nr:hypothetical protein FRC07_008423 [Ceratobasidium sp. 392]